MARKRSQVRLLIYSHDSFGLGHLRRCRAIAHSLVGHRKDLSVIILSGSPIIGSFEFRARVDFVRIPGVIKLRHGDYTPLSLNIDIDETLAMRASIIRHTADMFRPDIFLVDKEPQGLRGEVIDTLAMLKARGTPLVLGLRDIMDHPAHLAEEWQRKNAMPVLGDLYDHIWVYGLPEVFAPLEGLPVPAAVARKMQYTGYLKRAKPKTGSNSTAASLIGDRPYLLAITGGGGDGAFLIDWVLGAYEHDRQIPYPLLLVLGPFMRRKEQAAFMERVAGLEDVHAITFDNNAETLMADAAGIVSMGGYNTFCEILSFNKRSIIVPRTKPRLEQFLRASRAEELGLARMLADDGQRDPGRMAAALRELPSQPKPSSVRIPGLLDGLQVINRTVDGWLDASG